MSDMGVCEVCGKQATTKIADIRELPSTGVCQKYEVHSCHAFCESHKRDSITYAPR